MAGERSQFYVLNIDDEDAFGVANAAPSYVSLPCHDLATSFAREALPDKTVRIDRGEQVPIAGAKRASTFSFKAYASGLGTAAASTVLATQTPLGRIINSVFGTEVLGTGAVIKTAGGHVLTPTIATTGVIAANTWVGVVLSATYGTVWRKVASVAADAGGDTLTLSYALPEAPANGAIVYSSATYQWTDAVLTAKSFQAQLLNPSTDRKHLALGCYPNKIALEKLAPTQLGELSFDVMLSDYTDAESAALTNTTPSTKGAWMDSQAEIVPFGTTTYSANYRYALRDLQWSVTRGLVPRPDPHGTNGMSQWDESGDPAFELSVTLAINDDWGDAFAAGTYYHAFFAQCRTAGKFCGIAFAKIFVKEEPTIIDEGGIMAQNVKFGVMTGVTAPLAILGQG